MQSDGCTPCKHQAALGRGRDGGCFSVRYVAVFGRKLREKMMLFLGFVVPDNVL